ncbi:protein ROOT PRIMORDIUM DEFECTIVE 1 [Phalaenopsis equestris]|uniref:protein ROOT PRIMORDIUM DEFECTIVE 1 n=1 Tax=Phalaenopsis equestris TaxID=78828 RepID=UPI0009E58C38|nr:protein ROOT PRIMORDIUM DEFECTIVE 1 [Phalaenopsis equestris]XP_020582498.1 protein ROOT PRIMORDIUM DEFECTIVE 1 [Phalaenopsis equestris]
MAIRCFLSVTGMSNGIAKGLPSQFPFTTEVVDALLGCHFNSSQRRLMSKSRRVQDRSKNKRIHDLEIATERWKVASKILFIMDVIKKEPEQIIPLKNLEQFRQQINLSKPHRVCDFVRKSPKLFDLYKDYRGVVWCGFAKQLENLVEEEGRLIEENTETAVEHITRLLMMSLEKRLLLDKIAHFRRDFGFPFDFRKNWIHMFPEHFKVVKIDGLEYLELNSWNPSWAITELEKKALPENLSVLPSPGILCLPFPMKFPPNFKKVFRIGGKIEHFQKRPYLSPYSDPNGLIPGSQEFNKRAVAVMHEILSFTIEKRLVTDHLTHFRWEFVMPQKLMRLLLKHFGIFYVSERGKRFSVFLTEAYEGSQLIRQSPLALWKEKIVSLTGYRGRKRGVKNFDESLDYDEGDLFDGELDDQDTFSNFEDEESLDTIKEPGLVDDSEMDVRDLYDTYGVS